MAIVMSFTMRRIWGMCPNISVLGGGLNFVNMVPRDAEIVEACKKGDLLAVRDLFSQRKAAPNDMTADDRTLLFVSTMRMAHCLILTTSKYAAQGGSAELVRFLVNAGAPVRSYVPPWQTEIATF
jgi:hypothetical protein